MPWRRINNFEYAGYISDVDAHLVPPEVVSSVRNVHVDDGVVKRYPGFNGLITAPDKLIYLLSGGFTVPWLIGATKNKLYSLTQTSATDVTPSGGLTPIDANSIVGGVLHGIAVLTNGEEPPQYWSGTGTFSNLPNWIPGETCGMIRPFKNFLLAGNISSSSDNYPTKVRWSSLADPGSVPGSWDDSDPTTDAGSITLSDTPGAIIDGIQSLDSFFIYKEDAVYELQHTGGVFIFSQKPRFYNFGLLAKNCAFSLRGVNYVFGGDDIAVHTSAELKSIATKAVRKRIFNGISKSYQHKSFIAYDAMHGEVLFCVPWNSDTVDYAFTYNVVTGKWGERDLPQVGHITLGKMLDADTTWDESLSTWDGSITSWGSSIGANAYTFMVGQKLYGLNETNQHDGANVYAMAERRSIDFGSAVEPNERIKFVSRVRPNVIADPGKIVQVQIGSQMKLGDPVNWGPAQDFIVGTTRDLCFRVNGRYISWRVSATGDFLWDLESIDFDIKIGAMW